MKSFGEILLISCYELGHQPLGIAFPLAFLKEAGYQAESVDLSVETLNPKAIARASFVGICVPMHTALRLGVQAAERIREINSHCRICFYGLYASLNAEFLLNHVADFVIGGEFETPLTQLVEALSKKERVIVEGVSHKKAISAPFLKHLPFLLPQRTTLPPLEKYAQLEDNGTYRIVGYVEASRGCQHLCLHCPITPVYEGRFFLVPLDVVMQDIRQQVQKGATHITFGDPDFLNGANYSLKIAKALHEEFPRITFDFTAKVEHIIQHKALFSQFASYGCIFMISAVESLSDTVLKILEKGHTQKDIYEALSILQKAKIPMRPSWVAFTPWTTLDDYIQMLNFVEEENLIDHIDPVQYTVRLLIPPGSALLPTEALRPYLGSLKQENFSYQWSHPNPKMDHLQKEIVNYVEKAAQNEEDPFLTFHQIREMAHATRENRPLKKLTITFPSHRNTPPRLTESWFCCSEPTENQLNPIREQ